MQTRIPCSIMRGGTSKGAYFLAADLPADRAIQERILLAVMGSPDERQIDGIGGANPLTSKVAIVGPSTHPDADVDYLFVQVVVNEPRADYNQNCGNILAGVGPFAIERGLVKAEDGETRVRIHMVNSQSLAVATVQTPGRRVAYEGAARIDGVPGRHAPVLIDFLDVAGSTCGALLPTGNAIDVIDGVPCTLIDNGMPVVVMPAAALGCSGYESKKDLDADTELKARIQAIRLQAGQMMKLGDVTKKNVPKMSLIAPPRAGGAVCTRTFIPHDCHSSIGVLGAVTVATACVLPGGVAEGIAVVAAGAAKTLPIEHPTGEFTVRIETEGEGMPPKITRAALLRTARLLFDGHAHVPAQAWDGVEGLAQPQRTRAAA
ncbi:MAG TPA: 4-oxalomesaconate tautomerase [Burkholderiales bacterium]|nr:4-oxalomesaconate tautomerase [Burkholderiales bacterium]